MSELVVIPLLVGIASTIIWAEVAARGARLQAALLRRAACRLPVGFQDRWLEEWEAELANLPDAFVTRTTFALSIFLRRRSMAAQLVDRAPGRLSPTSSLVKRTLDVVIAGTSLLILLPTLGLIATVLSIRGRGRVIGRRPTVGTRGGVFAMYYFDTSYAGSMGRQLRKLGLDDLPCLWNVIVGDMAIVGSRPRDPEPTGETAEFIMVKPGLSWPELVHESLDSYSEHWNLFSDLRILYRTVRNVFQSSERG